MRGPTLTAAGLGGLVGGALGLIALAYGASRTLRSGLGLGEAGAVFEVTRASINLYSVIAGAVIGAVAAAVGHAVGRIAEPEERRYPTAPVLALGAATGTFLGYAATRTGLGAAADAIVEGVVTVGAFGAAIVALVAGAVTGAIVAGGVERLDRTAVYGFGGEAWPRDARTFVRDAAGALGLPIAAVVLAGAGVYALSQVLLQSSNVVALMIFSGAAAVVLFGAAAIAAREPKRRG